MDKPTQDTALKEALSSLSVNDAISSIALIMSTMAGKAALQERERAALVVESARVDPASAETVDAATWNARLAQLVARLRSGL
ncbi:MAG: hypothetical protein KGL39_16935 [Patescibacteria group bacterium]|nr:hypothetical protein [Patescibacteria group bacterium]